LYVLSYWEMLVRAGDPAGIPPVLTAFANQLKPENYIEYANSLERMRWNWLISTEKSFVIGDEPVCRSSPDRGLPCGLRVRDVQVFIPLSRYLCLFLSHDNPESSKAIHVDRDVVRNVNHLQVMGALQYVYGPSGT